MSDSLRLETLSAGDGPVDAVAWLAFAGLAERASSADGQPPFNDQAMADARLGLSRVLLVRGEAPARGDAVIAAAAVTDGVLELVVDPAHRRAGVGGALLARMLAKEGGEPVPRLAWAHGDHPAARRLAALYGFAPVRTLLQLRMPLGSSATAASQPAPAGPSDVVVDAFRPGRDDDDWVALNAKVFAGHPEQGRLTALDLQARMQEPWFDASDFLLARDAVSGSMIGYNWLKIDPAEPGIGEIYVIGVDPGHAGRGLGRLLMQHGLARLAARGCREAALYVDEDNSSAVPLYRSLGFTDHTIDVQYAAE